ARDRASSIKALPRFSASARRLAISSRDWLSCSWTLLLAFASSSLALSAAARPLAIFVARSSRAFVIGGHTNFIVNHHRIPKTTICANSVAFRFTARTFLGLLHWYSVEKDRTQGQRGYEGVSESH